MSRLHQVALRWLCLLVAGTFVSEAQMRRGTVPAWPDYSYCGYMAGEEAIPQVPARAFVPCIDGDATVLIQQAVDFVSSLEPDQNGFRGAVLLAPGVYHVGGQIKIAASGVVLRGSGGILGSTSCTEIVGTGDDRTTLVRVAGKLDRRFQPYKEISAKVNVGDKSLTVAGHSLKAGDRVRVSRLCTQEWIDQMDMNSFGGESSYIGWKPGDGDQRPGDVDIHWDRRVLSVNGDVVELDAPITCHIAVGEGRVSAYEWPGRISRCGVENLCLTSEWDGVNPKDENHRWMAVEMDNVEDAWVRRVEFRHFAGSGVFVTNAACRLTVEDCKYLAPVSELAAERRNAFFAMGGQCLFQRLYAQDGMHGFSVGRCTPGPVAFVQCFDAWPNHFSGAIGAWATGILFDVFTSEGGALSFANRGQDGMGAGWTAGYSMMWNCTASLLANPNPPTACNWANGIWGQHAGNAYWSNVGSYAKPHSLFYSQLAARGAACASDVEKLMPFDTQSASNPPIDKAQLFVAEARRPALQLTEWMDSLATMAPISCDKASDCRTFQPQKPVRQKTASTPKMHLENGVLVRDHRILTGRRQGIVWWNGSLKDRYTYNAGPHITRFAPGRTGQGFTDNLDEMTDRMLAGHVLVTNHHYGLWYDRRRDDHERIRRMDGYVWPPFYEQPFARSGEGSAYDGLSRYDLTKWNVWYWNRLKQYADLADEKGLVLYHQNYFQHNIIEAGAHWADCPWREANNINHFGTVEPVPYAGDKRVYMAEQFYDITDSVRASLHRNYIRKCLDNFADNGSVIQFVSEEFTGPLHFVQFWLDCIAEWEQETGKHPLIGLSTTKDVQDSILADPVRAKVVDVIDIKYWSPSPNGGFNAPQGGLSLAPRQFSRLRGNRFSVPGNGKGRSMDERYYETIADYRSRFPEKAVVCSNAADAWACFMGGASLCPLPSGLPAEFLQTAAGLQPLTGNDPSGCWVLGSKGKGYIVYSRSEVILDLSTDRKSYRAQWLDARSGQPQGEPFQVKGGQVYRAEGKGVLWLYR